ncbi:hypothetical protein DXG01_005911 [Tephrocybe rancida]|nr:hypothetical protein DXG01_005911 [Tephrocybe rancida]
MGINGLWGVLKEVRETVSLINLCTSEMLERKELAKRTTIVGVDLSFNGSILLDSCAAIAHKQGFHSQLGENAQLKLFFYKLCYFLTVPAAFVFVSDGPGRPPVKRGKKVKTKPLWHLQYTIALIGAFGFHYHAAPGEAEAELARLNLEGFIDIIITDDSDTLVFSGQCILRRIISEKDPDQYHAYRASSIESVVKLTHGGLVLFALLTGGDYDTGGVKGCGSTTALALARCGFGDTLVNAKETLSPLRFSDFLIDWRTAVRLELENNTRSSRLAAEGIGADFPDREILDFYTAPATSWTSNSFVDASEWAPRDPVISSIAGFCIQHFGWSAEQVEGKLRSKLWPGILTSMLFSTSKIYDNDTKKLVTPNANAQLVQIGPQISAMGPNGVTFRRVVVSTSNFVASMGIAGRTVGPNLSVKVPECLIPTSTIPLTFCEPSSKTSKRRRTEDTKVQGPSNKAMRISTSKAEDCDNTLAHNPVSADSSTEYPKSLGYLDLTITGEAPSDLLSAGTTSTGPQLAATTSKYPISLGVIDLTGSGDTTIIDLTADSGEDAGEDSDKSIEA